MKNYKVQMTVMIGDNPITCYQSTQHFTEEFFNFVYNRRRILEGFGPSLCSQFKDLMDKAIQADKPSRSYSLKGILAGLSRQPDKGKPGLKE